MKITGAGDVLGMKKFSVQHPSVRGYAIEPLYSSYMRNIGVLAPRYQFIKVVFNDVDWGVMAIEEHFSKEMMESFEFKETHIGKLNEEDIWSHHLQYKGYGPYDNAFTATYTAFSANKIDKTEGLKRNFSYAQSLMRAWQSGRLDAKYVFDLEKFARYIVANEIWTTHHPMRWHNIRFYLNL